MKNNQLSASESKKFSYEEMMATLTGRKEVYTAMIKLLEWFSVWKTTRGL